jgi:hypothetical protein
MGIAICCRSKHDGVDLGLSFAGVNTSGELAHTDSVKELMTSCEIKFLFLTPPSIGRKRIRGIRVSMGGRVTGVVVRGDLRSAMTVGVGGLGMKHRDAVGVMARTLLGLLLRCGASLGGTLDYIPNPTLRLKKRRVFTFGRLIAS